MKKPKRQARKVPKLYKEFLCRGNGLLMGRFSNKSYRNTNGTRLTARNAIGFVAKPTTKELIPCSIGYHAGTLSWFCVHSLRALRAQKLEYLYEVRLTKAIKFDDKWVGRSFKILRRIR